MILKEQRKLTFLRILFFVIASQFLQVIMAAEVKATLDIKNFRSDGDMIYADIHTNQTLKSAKLRFLKDNPGKESLPLSFDLSTDAIKEFHSIKWPIQSGFFSKGKYQATLIITNDKDVEVSSEQIFMDFEKKEETPEPGNAQLKLETNEEMIAKKKSSAVHITNYDLSITKVEGQVEGVEYIRSAFLKTRWLEKPTEYYHVVDITEELKRRAGFFKRNNISARVGHSGFFTTQLIIEDVWGRYALSPLLGFRILSLIAVDDGVEGGHPLFIVQVKGYEKDDTVYAYFQPMDKQFLGNIFKYRKRVRLVCEDPDMQGLSICHNVAQERLNPLLRYEYFITVEDSKNKLLLKGRPLQFLNHNQFVVRIEEEPVVQKIKVLSLKGSHKEISGSVLGHTLVSKAELVVKKMFPRESAFEKVYDVTADLYGRNGEFFMRPAVEWGGGMFSLQLIMRDYDRRVFKSKMTTFSYD